MDKHFKANAILGKVQIQTADFLAFKVHMDHTQNVMKDTIGRNTAAAIEGMERKIKMNLISKKYVETLLDGIAHFEKCLPDEHHVALLIFLEEKTVLMMLNLKLQKLYAV